nr:MAG TPA: hypothetical protein [Caudoviricetes sp.]
MLLVSYLLVTCKFSYFRILFGSFVSPHKYCIP